MSLQGKALAGAHFCSEGCRQRTTEQLSESFSSHRQVTGVRSDPGALFFDGDEGIAGALLAQTVY